MFARRLSCGNLDEKPDVLWPGSAASAHHVQPALFGEAFELACDQVWCFVVAAFLIGQAGVRHTSYAGSADLGESAQVIGHEVGTGCAVDAHPKQVAVHQRRLESLAILAREPPPHRLASAATRYADAGPAV